MPWVFRTIVGFILLICIASVSFLCVVLVTLTFSLWGLSQLIRCPGFLSGLFLLNLHDPIFLSNFLIKLFGQIFPFDPLNPHDGFIWSVFSNMAPNQSRLLTALAAGSAVAVMAAAMVYHKMKRRRGNRSIWVRKWIQRRETERKGSYAMLVDELRLEDPASYKNYLRMDEETFQHLVELVTPYLAREDTNMRQAERLAVTLRYLGHRWRFPESAVFYTADQWNNTGNVLCNLRKFKDGLYQGTSNPSLSYGGP